MSFDIEIKPEAQKDLNKLEKKQAQRIISKLEWFAQRPNRSKNVKYVEKYDSLRYRIGNFRIFFEKDNENEILHILTIDKRSQAYR